MCKTAVMPNLKLDWVKEKFKSLKHRSSLLVTYSVNDQKLYRNGTEKCTLLPAVKNINMLTHARLTIETDLHYRNEYRKNCGTTFYLQIYCI
jgi:predicted ATPase